MTTTFNAKLLTFVYPFEHPKAAAVDVLSTQWDSWRKTYLFEPAVMVNQLLPQIQSFKGILVLILDPPTDSGRQTQLRTWQ